MEKLYQKIVPSTNNTVINNEKLSDIITSLESKNSVNDPNAQIKLDINVKKDNEFKKIKKKTRNWVLIAHINPYWKNFSAVAMVISALCSSGIFLFLLLSNYNTLPDQIPVLYTQAIHAWSYLTREQTLIIPIAHLALSFIFLNLNLNIFKFDRRLVLTLNNSLILFNVVYLLEIFQIFTMLQVY